MEWCGSTIYQYRNFNKRYCIFLTYVGHWVRLMWTCGYLIKTNSYAVDLFKINRAHPEWLSTPCQDGGSISICRKVQSPLGGRLMTLGIISVWKKIWRSVIMSVRLHLGHQHSWRWSFWDGLLWGGGGVGGEIKRLEFRKDFGRRNTIEHGNSLYFW